MVLLIAEAREILDAPKTLVNILGWKPRPAMAGPVVIYNFEARVRASSSLPRGVWFRIVVRNVFRMTATFQLDCDDLGNQSHIPVYRLDWRPLRAHTNGNLGPPELHGLFFDKGVTHEHFCFDHVAPGEQRLRSGGVQSARRIDRDIADFRSALSHACDTINLDHRGEIPEPNAQGLMF